MDNICEFCNNRFNTISALNYHKDNAIYCLKLQGRNNIEQNKCDNCSRFFVSKKSLDKHLIKCSNDNSLTEVSSVNLNYTNIEEYINILEIKEKELNDYKNLLSEKEKKMKEKDNRIKEIESIIIEKDKQIKRLEDKIDKADNTIAYIAKQSKITNNTTNIKGNQTVVNILCDYKTYEKYTDKEHIISTANNMDMEKYFWNGQKGIANFCSENIVKTSDSMIICCTDSSRKKFKYMNNKNKIIDDINAKHFTERIAEPIKEVCKELYENIQKNIEDKLKSRDPENDHHFLSTKKTIAHEKYSQISDINNDNNNSEYKRELSALLKI